MKRIFIVACICILLFSSTAYAVQGDNGYEGGISSGGITGNEGTTSRGQSYDYQEVVFITGKPITFTGKVTVRRSQNKEGEKVTYTYNLTHGLTDRLRRTIVLDTRTTEKNNQIVKETILASNPTETITIDSITYMLDRDSSVNFSLSTITDDRPAVDYFAGNWNGKKSYRTSSGQRVTISSTGKLYGYDQYWGNTETQEILLLIEGQIPQDDVTETWGGTVDIKISSTSTQRLIYMDNTPTEISFEGGYLQKQENNSVLTYKARLPEFDADGLPTDRTITYKDDLSQQSFPQQTRLVVPDLKRLKGHWYENDVKQLYSLEIFDDNPINFLPNHYMTRAEFAKAIVLAGKIPVEEENETQRVNPRLTRNKQTEQEVISPYVDVPVNHPYFEYIDALYKNGVMTGVEGNRFNPDDAIDRAQALTIFIRVLGLESLAPNPSAVTIFRDNDYIPDWARNSIKVASYIGLVRGDDYGYLHPNEPMTKAQASAFLNRLVNYMRSGIVRDYRNRILIY